MFRKLFRVLSEPSEFFHKVRGEDFREPIHFLLCISAVVAIFTPLANWLGCPSTDTSSTFQAQILAWRLVQAHLLPRFGSWGYALEGFVILCLTLLLAGMLSLFVHLLYRIVGGKGSLLNAWKAVCYGTAPCALLGWVPYWSLFLGAWSLILQTYIAPKSLYGVKEGRTICIMALFMGSALLEFAMGGTTVEFGLQW